MAQLVGLIVSEDDAFKKQLGRLLRSGAIPVSVIDGVARDATPPDVLLVDARGDATSAMSSIERLRGGNPGAAIFAVALAADPDLILQSMRAGANEFFTWPPA
jgi:FixJ family two-component response regulator